MNGSRVQKVLIVNFDDDEEEIITDIVENDDRDVLSVGTSKAKRKILAYEPDLVFVSRPEESIQDIIESLEEIDKKVPVIVFSDDKRSIKRALIKGCDDYIVEPFEKFEIEHRISRHFGRRREKKRQGIALGPAPEFISRSKSKGRRSGTGMLNGHIYLIREPKPFRGFSIFREQVNSGVECIAFTRKNPREIRRDIEKGDPRIIWLSANRSSKETCIDAKDMSKITKEIDTFLKSNQNGMVFIDGLEYLVSQTDFQTVLRLLQYVNDKIMISDDRILISLDPRAFTSQEMSLIERECVLWEL